MTELRTQRPGFPAAMLTPAIICLFLAASSLLVPLPSLHIYDGKRILEVWIIAGLTVVALAHPAQRRAMLDIARSVPPPVAAALAVFFLAGLVSALRVTYPGYPLLEVGLMMSLAWLVFCVAAARVVAGQRFDRFVLAAICALGGALTVQECMGLITALQIGKEFSYQDMFIYFAHPRFYNQLQTWSVPLIAALPAVFPARRKAWVLALVLLGLQWYLMLASGARGSIVSVTSAVLLVGIVAFPAAKRWLGLHALGVALGGTLYAIVLAIQSSIVSQGGQFVAQSVGRAVANTTGRTWIWGFAWQDATRHPWLGAGPARFACGAEAELPGHPHNIVLQLAAEWGFPALALALLLVAFIGWKVISHTYSAARTEETGTRTLRFALAASLTAAAVHSGASGMLVMPASQLLGVLVGGWLLGLVFKPSEPAASKTDIRRRVAAGAAATVMAIAIASAAFATAELRSLEQRLVNFTASELRMPRFWHEGRVCRYEFPTGQK